MELILNLLAALGLGIMIVRQEVPAGGERIVAPAFLLVLTAWLTANVYLSGRVFSPVLVVLIASIWFIDAGLYFRLWLRSRSRA